MKWSFAAGSLFLLGLSIVLLLVLTVFESTLAGLSLNTERVVTFLLLVLPASLGAVLGALSLRRRERQSWLALSGMLLNAIFALFHLVIILFAG